MLMIDRIGFQSENWVLVYWITYLRNWWQFLSLPRPDECWLELIIICSTKCSRFGTLHSRPKQCNMSWIFLKSLLEICSVKFVDTL